MAGAGGMLGHDVVRAARHVNHEVVALAHADLDVTSAPAVRAAVREHMPEAVVNCAAYTAVDAAEDDLRGATDLNATAAGTVAVAAAEAGASVVYPSTDYVFDGSKSEPYVETDEPRALSVYGQTKLAGERETAAANPRHFVVRSSWLFGVNGRNFIDTMLELAADQGHVLVVRDQVGSPTWTGHLADAIVRLVDTMAFGLHHIASAGECSWYELALEAFEQAGVDCHAMSSTTAEFPRPAPRPSYSPLATAREDAIHLPDWREGVASFLHDRASTTEAR